MSTTRELYAAMKSDLEPKLELLMDAKRMDLYIPFVVLYIRNLTNEIKIHNCTIKRHRLEEKMLAMEADLYRTLLPTTK